jgi:hypothetical protein
MSYIKSILQEEFQRLKALLKKYVDEMNSLPRGSVSIKKRNHREYLYLAYRQKNKVRFEYIGPIVSENCKAVLKKIEVRKNYEDKLRQVKKDMQEIQKVMNGRKV